MATERKLFTIYKHICVPSGKAYVGVTQNAVRRLRGHRSPSSQCVALRNAIQKHGWSNFETVVLAQTESIQEAMRLEGDYIVEHETLAPRGYNLKTGGELVTFSDETKAKMSAALKGRPMSTEWRQKISNALTGRTATPEHRANMSEALRGKSKPPRTEEHKAKIAAANKLKAQDPIWRAKMSQAHKKRTQENQP